MILLCADGLTSKAVAETLGVHERTVGKWRRRFLVQRIDGLLDEPRPGRPRSIPDDRVAEVVERTLYSAPRDATPLVDPFDGQGGRSFPHYGSPNLDGVQSATASFGDLQAVERSAVR